MSNLDGMGMFENAFSLLLIQDMLWLNLIPYQQGIFFSGMLLPP